MVGVTNFSIQKNSLMSGIINWLITRGCKHLTPLLSMFFMVYSTTLLKFRGTSHLIILTLCTVTIRIVSSNVRLGFLEISTLSIPLSPVAVMLNFHPSVVRQRFVFFL